jgi:two-component response regulator czcR
MRILVVEDEKDLNNVICKILKKENYIVDAVFDGEEAISYIDVYSYEVILLDIMIPKLNGYKVLEHVKKTNINTKVIFITAKDSLEDKILGLDMGAEDYLVKPFEFGELLARIRVCLRKLSGSNTNILKIKNLELNITGKTVTVENKKIDLTAKEYEILYYLMLNKGKILSREQIIEGVYGIDYEGVSNTVDVLIKNIRKKLDVNENGQVYIQTKRGLGYVINE